MTNARAKAEQMLAKIKAAGYSDSQILNQVLGNFMSGSESVEALESVMNEFDLLEDACPSCGSTSIIVSHFDYNTAQQVHKCEDCEDEWY